MDLNELERAVLTKILAGDHPVLQMLRAQLSATQATTRELTGSGVYVTFDVPRNGPAR